MAVAYLYLDLAGVAAMHDHQIRTCVITMNLIFPARAIFKMCINARNQYQSS